MREATKNILTQQEIEAMSNTKNREDTIQDYRFVKKLDI